MDCHHRRDNRTPNQIRPISVIYDAYGYADASVFFAQGNTKVLVGITLQPTVPPFLKGQKTGWLSAEYAMLPNATQQRSQRESSQSHRNSRSVEISRLIGRCLRPIIDLSAIGERSIMVDCDVLQADGGTRVACITAASMALNLAVLRWQARRAIETTIIKEKIAAISVGVLSDIPYADLSYAEDSQADADFNFVFTAQGNLIEIQGTSEKRPISLELFEQLKTIALSGIQDIFAQCKTFPLPDINHAQCQASESTRTSPRPALFSLGNRLGKTLDSNQNR